jgi:hypothetical protein
MQAKWGDFVDLDWDGRKDIKTTVIYTHVLQRRAGAVKSPIDE